MASTSWAYKSFTELTNLELYAILQLRNDVFVLEQACLYQDADGKDKECYHLSAIDEEKNLIAYCRILPPGLSYTEASIGRVLTAGNQRKLGMGKELMERAIVSTLLQFKCNTIRISAQEYLVTFYQNLGFKAIGNSYLEDNIPHIEMLFSR